MGCWEGRDRCYSRLFVRSHTPPTSQRYRVPGGAGQQLEPVAGRSHRSRSGGEEGKWGVAAGPCLTSGHHDAFAVEGCRNLKRASAKKENHMTVSQHADATLDAGGGLVLHIVDMAATLPSYGAVLLFERIAVILCGPVH